MRLAARALVVLAVVIALAAAGITGFWFRAARTVRGSLERWVAAERARGDIVEFDGPFISGFPFAIRVRLEHPVFAGKNTAWRWSGAAVEAETRPWAFRTVTVHPIGRQDLIYPTAGGPAGLSGTAASADGVMAFGADGALDSFHGTSEGLAVTFAGRPGPIVMADSANLDLVRPPPAPPSGPSLPPSLAFTLRVEGVTLPADAAGPLGPKLQWLTVQGEVRGPVPFGPPAQALGAWRDEGGTLELKALDFAWGPLRLDGNATLALDGAMQPEGAGTAKISGFAGTIDALVAHHLMKPNNALMAKAVLGLMSKTPADGGEPVLTVPLTIQRQVLSAGPIRLARLPSIEWAP